MVKKNLSPDSFYVHYEWSTEKLKKNEGTVSKWSGPTIVGSVVLWSEMHEHSLSVLLVEKDHNVNLILVQYRYLLKVPVLHKTWQTVLVSDTEMAPILVGSQVPALSLFKSPKRPLDYDSPVTETPYAKPAPKNHKADEDSNPSDIA